MPSRAPLDALVLDLGNVLLVWDPRLGFPELTAPEFDEVAERIGFRALNLRADAGEPWERLAREVAAHHPEDAWVVEQYPARFPATVPGAISGMPDLVAEVRATGTPVLGLTNWSAETFPLGVAAVPLIATLDGVVVSGEEGVVKPDPAIFRTLLTRHGLDPARTLFVDDMAENVTAARTLGMAGHHFTSAQALRADLAERGVLPTVPRTSRN